MGEKHWKNQPELVLAETQSRLLMDKNHSLQKLGGFVLNIKWNHFFKKWDRHFVVHIFQINVTILNKTINELISLIKYLLSNSFKCSVSNFSAGICSDGFFRMVAIRSNSWRCFFQYLFKAVISWRIFLNF